MYARGGLFEVTHLAALLFCFSVSTATAVWNLPTLCGALQQGALVGEASWKNVRLTLRSGRRPVSFVLAGNLFAIAVTVSFDATVRKCACSRS